MLSLSLAIRTSLATGVLALAAACGGAPPPPAPAPAPPPAAEEPAGALPATWSDAMPKPQQMAFMKQKVLPRMSKVFQEHNAEAYAGFSCKTCHGPEYKNPHDFLPRLTLKDGKITAFAEKPEVSKFMHERVVPEMANAMGMPAYDEKTNKGFGCMGCHAVDMK
jgi:hypothetical protein